MSQTTYPTGSAGNIYPPTVADVTDFGRYSIPASPSSHTLVVKDSTIYDVIEYREYADYAVGNRIISKTITLSKPSILVIFGELHFTGFSGVTGANYKLQVRLDGNNITTLASSVDKPPIYHNKYCIYVTGVGSGNHTVDIYLWGTDYGKGTLYYAEIYILAI